MDAAWGSWIDESLQQLDERHLTRVLRPLVPTRSAVEADIHEAQLDAWLRGAPARDEPASLAAPPLDAAAAAAAAGGAPSGGGGGGGVRQRRLRRLKLFGLNDYLGLSAHPDVCSAAANAALAGGMGPRSSALVCGWTTEHRALELDIARLKGTEDCLLFPTGYAANMAVLTVLAAAADAPGGGGGGGGTATQQGQQQQAGQQQHGGQQQQHQGQQQGQGQVVIFSDELNHASIIDGARLACRGAGGGGTGGARLVVYRHGDLGHLEQLLGSCPAGARKLVVTDGLFSMDGDFADLRGLARLRARHGFLLIVDDAHATLTAGEHGGGTAEMQAAPRGCVDVTVGTLSKAAGALGGFAACSAALRRLLLNRGRHVIFSTALPLPVVAAARAALRVSQRESWRRRHLWALVRRFSARLGVPAHSPVIPLIIGPEAATMDAARQLLARGFHVGAIRPPTVAPGTCRLRVSLSAAHSFADVDALADALLACRAGAAGGGGGALAFAPLPHLQLPAPWTGAWLARQDALDAAAAAAAGGAAAGGGGAGHRPAPRSRL
ncbi:MAG: pyridoxal phosphate-dependent transferase [Monoraphidium minutum]|nr:MAG: pyridoxal phosphate-dependent transferase [Monoraphidium minutum]